MAPTDNDSLRQAAFDLLVTVVRDRREGGRSTHAAGIKPELQKRSFGGFDEGKLGFPTFKSFLDAAQAHGTIDLRRTPDGADFEVLLPGQPVPTETTERTVSPSGRYVRSDFWSAFTEWSTDVKRYYDVSNDRAVMLLAVEHPLEKTEHTALRQTIAQNPENFIEIHGIAMETQLQWMKEFAENVVTATSRESLLRALQDSRPFAAFTRAVRVDQRLSSTWKEARLRHIIEEIQQWAEQHSLNVHYLETPRSHHRNGLGGTTLGGAADVPLDVATLRQIVHRAVDRMPSSELLRLALPLEYLT